MARRPHSSAALVSFVLASSADAFCHHAPSSALMRQQQCRTSALSLSTNKHGREELRSLLPTYHQHHRHDISRPMCKNRSSRHIPGASATSTATTSPSMMSISAEDPRITVTVQGSYNTELSIKASHVDHKKGVHRTWIAHRSEKDFFILGTSLMGALGGGSGLPGPPPVGSSPAVLEGYLRRLLDVPMVTSQPAMYDFLQAPPDVAQEPVLFGEVCGLRETGGVGCVDDHFTYFLAEGGVMMETTFLWNMRNHIVSSETFNVSHHSMILRVAKCVDRYRALYTNGYLFMVVFLTRAS